MALTFIPNPENKPQVNHISAIKSCDVIWNLEWNTQQENINHAYGLGLIKSPKGEKHWNCKLTDKEILDIHLEYHKGNISKQTLAKKYGVSSSSIVMILNGKRRKDIFDEFQLSKNPSAYSGP